MQKNGKTFLLKLALFLAPFALVLLAEITLLPLDAFAFRSWEAVAMSRNPWIQQFAPTMPFYPETRLEKTETGDLGHHTIFAREKKVVWEVDSWGFRNGLDAAGPYDVVIVGDSFTAGSGLSQKQTLASSLERLSGLRAYAYAPGEVDDFLAERRFRTRPRPVVVYQFFERDIVFHLPRLDEAHPVRVEEAAPDGDVPGALGRAWDAAVVALDRYCKGAMLLSSRARFRERVAEAVHRAVGVEYVRDTPAQGAVVGKDGRMLFLLGGAANAPIPDYFFDASLATLHELDHAVRESGFRLILLPVPNKENIYYDLTSNPKRPEVLDKLIARLRSDGIEVVDLQPAFREARDRGVPMFHLDDTHWTAEAAALAARELGEHILEGPQQLSAAP